MLWKELLFNLELLLSLFVRNCSARQLPLNVYNRLLLVKFLSHPLAEGILESIPCIRNSPFQLVKFIEPPTSFFLTTVKPLGERIPLLNSFLELWIMFHCGLLRLSELSGPTSVNPSAHPCDSPHHGRIWLKTSHQRLHISADTPGKVMVQEGSDIRVLHDQVLLGIANKTWHPQPL